MIEYDSLYALEENNDGIEIEVGNFTVNDDDNIIVKFDMNHIDGNNLKIIMESIKKTYPNHKVIAIPDFVTVDVFNKNNIIKYLEQIIDHLS